MKSPNRTIVPVVGLDDHGAIVGFWGTAFFVSSSSGHLLVTANHVLPPAPLRVAVAPLPELVPHEAVIVHRDASSDLALLRVQTYAPPAALTLAEDAELVPNEFILTLEYGRTRALGQVINISAATRIGHITRHLADGALPGQPSGDLLELSFPVLRGASGAPVVSRASFKLWGVLVGNASYELQPAQVETILNDSGSMEEEIKYMLPQGLAIPVSRLRQLLRSSQLD